MFSKKTGYITTIGFGHYCEGYLHAEDWDRAIELSRRGNEVALHGTEHRDNAPPRLIYRPHGRNRGWWFDRLVSIYRTPDRLWFT